MRRIAELQWSDSFRKGGKHSRTRTSVDFLHLSVPDHVRIAEKKCEAWRLPNGLRALTCHKTQDFTLIGLELAEFRHPSRALITNMICASWDPVSANNSTVRPLEIRRWRWPPFPNTPPTFAKDALLGTANSVFGPLSVQKMLPERRKKQDVGDFSVETEAASFYNSRLGGRSVNAVVGGPKKPSHMLFGKLRDVVSLPSVPPLQELKEIPFRPGIETPQLLLAFNKSPANLPPLPLLFLMWSLPKADKHKVNLRVLRSFLMERGPGTLIAAIQPVTSLEVNCFVDYHTDSAIFQLQIDAPTADRQRVTAQALAYLKFVRENGGIKRHFLEELACLEKHAKRSKEWSQETAKEYIPYLSHLPLKFWATEVANLPCINLEEVNGLLNALDTQRLSILVWGKVTPRKQAAEATSCSTEAAEEEAAAAPPPAKNAVPAAYSIRRIFLSPELLAQWTDGPEYRSTCSKPSLELKQPNPYAIPPEHPRYLPSSLPRRVEIPPSSSPCSLYHMTFSGSHRCGAHFRFRSPLLFRPEMPSDRILLRLGLETALAMAEEAESILAAGFEVAAKLDFPIAVAYREFDLKLSAEHYGPLVVAVERFLRQLREAPQLSQDHFESVKERTRAALETTTMNDVPGVCLAKCFFPPESYEWPIRWDECSSEASGEVLHRAWKQINFDLCTFGNFGQEKSLRVFDAARAAVGQEEESLQFERSVSSERLRLPAKRVAWRVVHRFRVAPMHACCIVHMTTMAAFKLETLGWLIERACSSPHYVLTVHCYSLERFNTICFMACSYRVQSRLLFRTIQRHMRSCPSGFYTARKQYLRRFTEGREEDCLKDFAFARRQQKFCRRLTRERFEAFLNKLRTLPRVYCEVPQQSAADDDDNDVASSHEGGAASEVSDSSQEDSSAASGTFRDVLESRIYQEIISSF